MTLGIECIKFLLEQDPANVPIVQRWIDKWFWRGYRLLTLVSMMLDFMVPKKVMSWKEAWEMYFVQNGGSLFNDLGRYGIRMPKYWEQTVKAADRLSSEAWNTFYNYSAAANFNPWCPTEENMDWMSQKYPDTFDKYYRPRFEYYREQERLGKRFYNTTLPMLCQCCQIPLLFSEPDDPTQICYRESEYNGEKYHTCSDGCKDIFDHEPEKYVQSWLPVHQIYQGNCFKPGTDPTAKDFNPLAAVLEYYNFGPGDNMDYVGSPDEANWLKWKGLTKQEPGKKAA